MSGAESGADGKQPRSQGFSLKKIFSGKALETRLDRKMLIRIDMDIEKKIQIKKHK